MRHGVAFRKLSRDTSHRTLLLRNLVSSLLQHERIKTTLAKAKEASRVAEWVITWGKGGSLEEKRRAEAFLMNPQLTVPKLFLELSHRYASRAGGYTRIHRFGNRKGDHAPHAILELVDNPNDLKFSFTAKIVGRELAKLSKERNGKHVGEVARWAASISGTAESTAEIVAAFTSETVDLPKIYDLLSPRTRDSVVKALRYRATPFASSPSSSDASTSTSSGSSTSSPALEAFEALARDSFYQATAISKVPDWGIDTDKYEDILAANVTNESTNVPLTLPGHGRKVWAGQEDINRFQVSSRRNVRDEQERRTVRQAEAAEEEWQNEKEEDAEDADLAQQEMQKQEARRERLMNLQKKKLRHPDGRNGINGVGRAVTTSHRSALSRAKGHVAAPRTLEARRSREGLPHL